MSDLNNDCRSALDCLTGGLGSRVPHFAELIFTQPALPTVCAWCNRQRIGDTWTQVIVTGPATQGICPECAAKFRAENELLAEAVFPI